MSIKAPDNRPVVMKFGGTLMGSGEAIQRSAGLAASTIREGAPTVVVVSAMAGVTESLLAISSRAERGDLQGAVEDIARLRSRHLTTADTLGAGPGSDTVRDLRDLFETLRQTVTGVALLRELSARSKDLIVSFGERLSAPLMAVALTGLGVRTEHLTGGEAGILTDPNFGSARPLPEAYDLIRERIGNRLMAGISPVVTGFIGESRQGVITTLGRGGSDYTATIIGAAVRAREVWTWKDVDGVMSADPRLVPQARNLSYLSYAEVMELAYFGAKVLHPLAVTPLQKTGIPLRVKSAADPSFPGTLVTSQAHADGAHPVKAATAIRNLAIVTVGGAGMVGVPDVVSQIFQVIAREGINVHMISQASSQANVSIVVSRADADRTTDLLRRSLDGMGLVKDFEVQPDVAAVAVVGEGMRGQKGVAAKLFGALADASVNLLMIAQGSSELNISFVIEDADVEAAVKAAHAAFDLGAQDREQAQQNTPA